MLRKYCNRACYRLRSPKKKENCETCGVEFYRVSSQSKFYPRRFCSLSCRSKGNTGTKSPRYHERRVVDSDGYIRCVVDGVRGLEHILIAEKSLGRKLWRKEVVHHVNGIKTDNRPDNLIVCSQSMHRRLHDHMGFLYQSAIQSGSERGAVESLLQGLR